MRNVDSQDVTIRYCLIKESKLEVCGYNILLPDP